MTGAFSAFLMVKVYNSEVDFIATCFAVQNKLEWRIRTLMVFKYLASLNESK
jgi:hypothetical protein